MHIIAKIISANVTSVQMTSLEEVNVDLKCSCAGKLICIETKRNSMLNIS
jgi:hypothetical protein